MNHHSVGSSVCSSATQGAEVGTVLAYDDARAWHGLVPGWGTAPDIDVLTRHVARCRDTIPGFDRKVPVLWPNGSVTWEQRIHLTSSARIAA